MNSPEEHSPIGGSVAHRFINCPASPRLSEGFDESNEAADEGTFAHFVAQQVFKHGLLKVTPQTVINYEPIFHLPGPNKNLYVDKAEKIASAVQLYVDTVCSFLMSPEDQLFIEQKVYLNWWHSDLWGAVDALVYTIAKKWVLIIDYKNGYIPVEVEGNVQLMYYAIGAIGENNPNGIEEVTLCIVQPNGNHPDGPVRYWNTTVTELFKWGAEVLAPAARATDNSQAPAVVGPWCKYCPANARTCQEVSSLAVELLPVVSGREAMSTELLVKLLKFDNLYGPFMKNVYAGAVGMAKKGIEVPDHKLVRGTTKRKWVNEIASLTQLKNFYGVSVLVEPKEKLKAFTALENELPPGALAGHLIRPEGALTLVPKSDGREEVVCIPGDEFKSVALPAVKKKETS